MEYKFLKAWAEARDQHGLFFRQAERWRDQYRLVFNEKKYLQVNLQSQDPFCFFTDADLINWQPAGELAKMQEHLHRAKLTNISCLENERIIILELNKPDPFKQVQRFRIYLELIPQFTNIILTKHENDKWMIIDCSRKVSLSENHYRQLIPAVEYEVPPSGYKNDASQISMPLCFNDKLKIVENCENGKNDLNSFLEDYYYNGYLQKIIYRTKTEKIKKLKKEIRKKEKKLAKQKEELESASAAEKWQQLGELLKAHLHLIKKGMTEITVTDYYSADMPQKTIKLFGDKSPSWNVDHYFKKYRKALKGKEIIKNRIELTGKEIALLQEQITVIEDQEYILPGEFVLPQTAQLRIDEKLTRIPIDNNWELVVGRNSKENDYITTRLAKPDDWWFHTRIFKGTHVLLRNFRKQQLPENLLDLGCRLAAGYSKAAKSSNVPVDYTQIRYVRKPRNSAPGFVIYTHQKTLFVDPIDIRTAGKLVSEQYGSS